MRAPEPDRSPAGREREGRRPELHDLLARAQATRIRARQLRLQLAVMRSQMSGAEGVRAQVQQLRHRLARAENKVANLQRAVASNRRIGIAVGILMARHNLTEDQAFAVLRQVSNEHNRKLRDVAERVIHTGTV